MNKDLVSYCGIYCGACPSLVKRTCLGCRPDNKSQKRKSKWGCTIRKCCQENTLDFCFECKDYPCSVLIKLKNSHLQDERYDYRHQMFYNLIRIKKIGLKEWLDEQLEIWHCSKCGGTIVFYENKCLYCGETTGNLLKEYMKESDE